MACRISAQNPAPGSEQTLQDRLAKKQLFLRNYSGENVVGGRWDQGVLTMDSPHLRSLYVFQVTAVRLKAGTLHLTAERHGIVRHDGKVGRMPLGDTVDIRIGLGKADLLASWPTIAESLFFGSYAIAKANLPRFRSFIPADLDVDPHAKGAGVTNCDCADTTSAGCEKDSLSEHLVGKQQAKVKSTVEPEYPEAARRERLNGRVEIGMTIDTAGKARDLWVIRSAGMGMDQSAADAVSQYSFQPAQCHGIPVPDDIYATLTFKAL